MTDKIKNTTTSDSYLSKWGYKHIPGFSGVFSRDVAAKRIPKMKPGDSIIINLDSGYKHDGSHWVALRFASEAPIIMYCDPFGTPPPEDVRHASLTTGRGVLYGNRIYQSINETNCGKRALVWLFRMELAAQDGKELEKFRELA